MAVHPATASSAPQVTGAIRQAAQSTGISFEYLLTTAKIESNFNPSAQASTSSAKGLYQFIDQTWLGTMKQDGAALGLGRYADAIERQRDGRYAVSDPRIRSEILRLRSDPQASAMLAGALTRNNSALVSTSIGRQPTNGELYIAHFLGADGAGKLINGASKNPRASAASMFPHAAAANRTIFYDTSGRARSVGEVYGKLTRLFNSARDVAVAQRGEADTQGSTPSSRAPPLPTPVTIGTAPVKSVPGNVRSAPRRSHRRPCRRRQFQLLRPRQHQFQRQIPPASRKLSRKLGRNCHRRLQRGSRSSRCSRIGSASLWRRPSITFGARPRAPIPPRRRL